MSVCVHACVRVNVRVRLLRWRWVSSRLSCSCRAPGDKATEGRIEREERVEETKRMRERAEEGEVNGGVEGGQRDGNRDGQSAEKERGDVSVMGRERARLSMAAETSEMSAGAQWSDSCD